MVQLLTFISIDTPTFPEARHIQKYLHDYSSHFDLERHIRLRTEVLDLTFNEDDMKWTVQTLHDGETTSQAFDKVVLATGINKLPLIPDIGGLDEFKGEVIHSGGYKR